MEKKKSKTSICQCFIFHCCCQLLYKIQSNLLDILYYSFQYCHGPGAGWKRISRHETEWREIKFIRMGDTVRIAGQLKGKPTLNRGLWSTFIPTLQGVG